MDHDAHLSAAQQLIAQELLTQNQLTKALEYQCRLPPGQYLPLLQVILEFEFVTEQQLIDALGEDYLHQQDPVGRILVEQGIVSAQQLEQALEILNSFSRQHVADIFIDLGFVTREEIEQAISRHQIEISQGLKQQRPSLIPTTEHQTSHDISAPDPDASEAAPPPKPDASAPVPTNKLDHAVIHLPLGRQLIAKGLISEHELRDALEYQQRLPRVMHRPIGEILVMLGYIDEEQLKEALSAQPPQGRSRIGELLIAEGLIEEWQLAHALSLQFSPEHAHKKLGTLLVELGYAKRDEIEGTLARHYRDQAPVPTPEIAPAQPVSLVPETPHVPLGQILLNKGFITQAQLDEALSQQSRLSSEYRPLGDILILMGYINEFQLQEALSEQPGFKREPIGQILVRQGLLEEWQLSHALCLQFDPQTGERRNLGSILVQLGYATQEAIEAAVLQDLRQKRSPGLAADGDY